MQASRSFIGFDKISHENISGKRAATEGAGLNVSGPAKPKMQICFFKKKGAPDPAHVSGNAV